MGRGQTLNKKEIGKMLALKQEDYSNHAIAEKINRNPWKINNYLKNQENYGKYRKGRTARATTGRERRSILREESNSAAFAHKIKENLEFQPVSA